MKSSLACALAIVVGCVSTGCISKGDTQITSNTQTSKSDDDGQDAGPSRHPARPSANDDDVSEPEPKPEPADTPEPTPEPAADDAQAPAPAVVEPEPTKPNPKPAPSASAPSGGGGTGGSTSEPAPSANGGSGGTPVVTTPTVACSPDSGAPALGTVENLTDGDLVDKSQFSFAAGAGEDFVAWVDAKPSGPSLGWLTRDDMGASEPAYVEFQAETTTPAPFLAAVYSPEANAGAGAYALAWKDGSSVQFNWLADAQWVLSAPSDNPGQFTVPYVSEDGIAMAYDGTTYGIIPLAQHPYLLSVSATGTGTIALADGDRYTRQEARDVVIDEDGNFITVGRYHNGSVGDPVNIVNLFVPGLETGTAVTTADPVFQGFGVNDLGPKGIELVWDGAAVGVVYGGDAISAGLQYSRVTTTGVVAKHQTVDAMNLTPLDAWIDRDAQVIYVLSTDAESDLYFVGIDVKTGSVVVSNGVVAAGAGVTAGYLSWDAAASRFRAYFASTDDGGAVHQISTTLIACRKP